MTPLARHDVESWVVNTLKLKMIRKFEEILELEGKSNLRKLLIVPVFTLKELTERIESNAPELKTLFFKELFVTLDEAEKKLT